MVFQRDRQSDDIAGQSEPPHISCCLHGLYVTAGGNDHWRRAPHGNTRSDECDKKLFIVI